MRVAERLRATVIAGAAAFALAAHPGAQASPAEAPTATGQSAKAPRTPADHVTDVRATGCLSKTDQARVLVLAHLRWVSGGPKGTAATKARAKGGEGESIKVNAAGGVDLNAHVGHQVEVTGKLVNAPSSPGATSVPTEPDPAKTKPLENRAVEATKNPAIDVTAVKMIADSCAGL
jgi:hypothetical protein